MSKHNNVKELGKIEGNIVGCIALHSVLQNGSCHGSPPPPMLNHDPRQWPDPLTVTGFPYMPAWGGGALSITARARQLDGKAE